MHVYGKYIYICDNMIMFWSAKYYNCKRKYILLKNQVFSDKNNLQLIVSTTKGCAHTRKSIVILTRDKKQFHGHQVRNLATD